MAMQNFAKITDTRLGAHSNKSITYVVEEGAQNVAYVPLVSSSHSNQTTTWNLNNIAQFVGRDSRLNVTLTATITLNVTNSTGSTQYVVNGDNFGQRQFCYNRAVASCQHKINQASYTLLSNQILDAIARLNMVPENADFYDNTQPDCVDSYANASGTNLTPLAAATSNIQGQGVFKPRTLNFSVSGNAIPANSSGTVTITVQIYEPLISPFNNIGDKDAECLYAINGEIITVNYTPDLWNNMFCFYPTSGITVNNASVDLGRTATLNCIYLTAYPNTIKSIPHQSLYHYNDYLQYTNDLGAVASGATLNGISSQVCNFTNIPQKILIYARPSDNVRNVSLPDIYLAIQNISVVFDNGQPQLSSASPDQLYDISHRNGLRMSREQFQSKVLNAQAVAMGATAIKGVGSVLVIDPALDLGLRETDTNGTAGRFVFQVQNAIFKNNTTQNLAGVTLYVVGVTNAILERSNGSEYHNYNLSLPYDVFQKAKELPAVSHEAYVAEKFSNLFLSGGGIGDWFKKALNLGKMGISQGLKHLSAHPELIQHGLSLAQQALGSGARMVKRTAMGARGVHPKKNMDLYFE